MTTHPHIGINTTELYLDLMKQCITRSAFPERYRRIVPSDERVRKMLARMQQILSRFDVELVRRLREDDVLQRRTEGRDWPADAETMIGIKRLESLHDCCVDVIRRDIPGDFIETGVWRGGAVIYMRAVLKAYGVSDRIIWAADSFRGLPRPDIAQYPADLGNEFFADWSEWLAVSLDEVRRNFARYGLLDGQVRFLAGWFRDTLPSAPISKLAILRLDGDMYESTMDALRPLYPKLSVGGYIIVDDYGAVDGCRIAVDEYRSEHGITEPIERIDWGGVFWRKEH